MDILTRDLQLALRGLRRTPGFTAAVIAMLALAIGATTAVWTVVHGALLRPLPHFDVDRWAALAHAALDAAGAHGELTLTFVDRAEIAGLNAEHLGKDGPTDVLSFPLDAEADADAPSQRGVPVLLGDVVVCPAVAERQAPSHAGSYEDELALLVVHGVLHVLGHDHDEPEETAVMQARERELLDQFHHRR